MEVFYQVIAILTAGISLTIGCLSLLTYMHKGGEKIHLVFGILCLLVFIFILLPPVGFVLINEPPYLTDIKVKKIFNLAFLGLFPWFIRLYTGYQKRTIPLIVSVSIVICYLVTFQTSTASAKQLLVLITITLLAVILVHSFYAAFHQFSNGQKTNARWLFVAMGVFAFFNLLGAISQPGLNAFSWKWTTIFLPANLCPLAFIVIMGLRLQANSNKQFRLEKILKLRDNRWQSLLEHMQLIVVNTDLEGRIQYINPYGIRLLEYKDASQLINTNWADHCLPANEPGNSKTDFTPVLLSDAAMTANTNTNITKDGKQRIINWKCDLIYNDNGDLVGKMNIGSDITKQEDAIHQIQELKAQLEKESLVFKKNPVASTMPQGIIGNSVPFMYAIQKSKQVAATNASVLLLGETGVGKECFADLIQETSLRCNKPFVKVNCGALPAELIEDELFGHEKGAFTGALQARMGRFEKANGGTIFLDEIGELPLVLQPKLLRVLQNGEFERVGGHQTIKVDVRVIAATNSDLEKEVRENRFRDDLFYRLNVFPITIPPLRKRNGDIMLLIQYLIEKKSREHGKQFENISKNDINRLTDYQWPGNIRELKNVIERAVISSESHTLKLDWFYEEIQKSGQAAASGSMQEMEIAHILKVLQECAWKINGENGAAEKLVMHPNTLRSRMKKLNISAPWKNDQLVT
jgi:PAS domain S-box-containing protein